MEIESGAAEKTIQHFMKYKMRSKIKIEPLQWGKLLIAGPSARAVLEAALKQPLPDPTERSFSFQPASEVPLVIRTSQTGEDDYHLYCHEARLETRWNNLIATGEKWGIARVGQTALQILRIEAGIPRYGTDIDEDRFPVEAGLEESAISYTKGCYPGQEVVARTKTYGHVNRRLTGLIIKGEETPKYQDTLFQGDQEVGWVTSSVISPLLETPIAMAYLKNSVNDGIPVEVSMNVVGGELKRRVTAIVTKLPFYERGVTSPAEK
jgi:aminomethyltransferase